MVVSFPAPELMARMREASTMSKIALSLRGWEEWPPGLWAVSLPKVFSVVCIE
jgi:hypothetical protein